MLKSRLVMLKCGWRPTNYSSTSRASKVRSTRTPQMSVCHTLPTARWKENRNIEESERRLYAKLPLFPNSPLDLLTIVFDCTIISTRAQTCNS